MTASSPAVVVHIGLPKGATTAVQRAASEAREDLHQQGVLYPGSSINHMPSFRDIPTVGTAAGPVSAEPSRWAPLVEEVRGSSARAVFISAEILAGASTEFIDSLNKELGGIDRVVITVRPFAAMLPSVWQQRIKQRRYDDFREWTDEVLSIPPQTPEAQGFWGFHDLADVAARWSAAVTDERVSIVVADPRRPRAVIDAVEDLLAVRRDTLRIASGDGATENRSLTGPEVELLRGVNGAIAAFEWRRRDHMSFLRKGMVGTLQRERRPLSDEPRHVLSATQITQVCASAMRSVDTVKARGYDLRGDIDEYASAPSTGARAWDGPEATIDPDLVETALAGIVSIATGSGTAFEARPDTGRRDRIAQQAPALPPDRQSGSPTSPAPVRVVPLRALPAAARDDASFAVAVSALHAELTRDADRPLVLREGDQPAVVAFDPSLADDIERACDLLADAHIDRRGLDFFLPSLTEEISWAWARAAAGGGEPVFARWLTWACRPESWGAFGALPDPHAYARAFSTLRTRLPRLTIRLATPPRSAVPARRIGEDTARVVSGVAGRLHGRGVDQAAALRVLLLGAVTAASGIEVDELPCTEGSAAALQGYRRARRDAARGMMSYRLDGAGALIRWARQSDSSAVTGAHDRRELAGISTALATDICVGAFSAASGRGFLFESDEPVASLARRYETIALNDPRWQGRFRRTPATRP